MLTDKKGNRIFRRVWIKVVYPEAIFPPKIMIQKAGPHQGFGAEGIGDLLIQTADKLETLFPYWEFRMTELAPQGRMARYVFTFDKYSAAAMESVKQNGEATTIAAIEGARLPGPVDGPLADFK